MPSSTESQIRSADEHRNPNSLTNKQTQALSSDVSAMRRSPFYAYNPYPPSSSTPAHRHPPPSSSAVPPGPRSVINIPVHDVSASRPSPAPTRPAPPAAAYARPLLDPTCAAIKIQSCFRGFRVRQHRPLLHLRSITSVRTQLDQLRSELESPGFGDRVKSNEKEKLHFTESVMALILRLDEVQGSVPEVRSRRKEATKMAIMLQDAVDDIVMQQENTPQDGSLCLGYECEGPMREAQGFKESMPPDTMQEESSTFMCVANTSTDAVQEDQSSTFVSNDRWREGFSTPIVDDPVQEEFSVAQKEVASDETVINRTTVREAVAEAAMCTTDIADVTSSSAGDAPETTCQNSPHGSSKELAGHEHAVDYDIVSRVGSQCASPSDELGPAVEVEQGMCVSGLQPIHHDYVNKQSPNEPVVCINDECEEGIKAKDCDDMGQKSLPCGYPNAATASGHDASGQGEVVLTTCGQEELCNVRTRVAVQRREDCPNFVSRKMEKGCILTQHFFSSSLRIAGS